ncbi:JAB domain-containing protein [Pseudomonas sp.]|uniref:JAB domain-containing protein n=1 Tax=Pseudomonas sp. TaxID=306 RepID=UPI00258CA459|nr:JAB domain-containing protein [Pseudomonas sp.]
MSHVKTIESPAYTVFPAASANEDWIIAQALAILEKRVEGKDLFDSPKAVSEYLIVRNGARPDQGREVFSVMYLDSQHRLIEAVDEFTGTLTQTSVYPREIVRSAMARNAAAVILCHNHPSGTAQPSRADETITQKLKSALALVDVRVLDHFVTAGGKAVSMAELGLV